MNFEDKLQKLRKDKGLSQEQLAELLNVTRQAVSKWESGQSYPEMDKLLLLCKIFNCTLDELTNDTISTDNINTKGGFNKGTKFINNFLNDVNKSIDKFKSMTNDQIKKCIIELLVIVIILSIIHIPLSEILHAGYFYDYSAINTIWNVIAAVIEFGYFLMSIFIIFYIFKIRYLNDSNLKEEIKEEKKPTKKEEKVEQVIAPTPSNPWKTIVMVFIKFIVACIAFSFTMSVFGLFMSFFIILFLTIDGINLVGPLLIIFSFIMIFSLVSEILWGIVISAKRNYKKYFVVFIIFTIMFSIGTCLSSIEMTKYTYYNTIPSDETTSTITRELEFNSNYYLSDDVYSDNVTYTINNNIGNKMIVQATYYPNYTSPSINFNGNEIDVDYFGNEFKFGTQMYNEIKKDLKEYKVYNYGKLYSVSINITASEQNINSLRYFIINN